MTDQHGRAAHLGPERRRPQVLDAALAISLEEGVGEVTIGAIAKRLEVTRPVVYACFADRVEIITALLERETGRLRDALVTALRSARGDGPDDAFVTGIRVALLVGGGLSLAALVAGALIFPKGTRDETDEDTEAATLEVREEVS